MATQERNLPRATSARVLTATFNIFFGLRFLWPDDILGGNENYRYMERVFFGDVYLGLALLLFGAVMAVGIRSDPWTPAAVWCVSVAWLTWMLIAVLLLVANVQQVGSLAYLFIAATHAYAYAHTIRWRNQLARGATP